MTGEKTDRHEAHRKRDGLSEEISRAALRLSSALTDDYRATLDAVRHLDNQEDQRAADRLRDAALLARDDELSDEFRELADRVEGINE